jgi:hypothetical protein
MEEGRHMISRCVATAICFAGMSAGLRADCVVLGDPVLRAKQSAAFIFDGTVTRVEHVASDGARAGVDDYPDNLMGLMQPQDRYLREYAATLKVHRVWKGNVSKEFTVYFVPNWDGPSFKKGRRQIVVAVRQTAEMRRPPVHHNGLDPEAPLRDAWVEPCTGFVWDNKDTLKQLGRSQNPSSKSDSR